MKTRELADLSRELTEEEKARSFAHKPPLARIAIVMAGPVFNLLFAWLIFIVLCMTGSPDRYHQNRRGPQGQTGCQGRRPKERCHHRHQRQDRSPTGMRLPAVIAASKGQPVSLTVKRDSRDLQFTITPEPRVAKNLFGEEINGYAIGVASAGEVVTEYYNPFQAVVKGTAQTWKVIDLTIMSLVKMAQRVVPMDSVGGPIMIAKMAGETGLGGRLELSGLHGAAVDQPGCTQPAAGAGAGWRASLLLLLGIDFPPAGQPKGARIRPADRDVPAVGPDGAGVLQRYRQIFFQPARDSGEDPGPGHLHIHRHIAIAVDERILPNRSSTPTAHSPPVLIPEIERLLSLAGHADC